MCQVGRWFLTPKTEQFFSAIMMSTHPVEESRDAYKDIEHLESRHVEAVSQWRLPLPSAHIARSAHIEPLTLSAAR